MADAADDLGSGGVAEVEPLMWLPIIIIIVIGAAVWLVILNGGTSKIPFWRSTTSEDAAPAVEAKAETINEQLVVAAKRGDSTQVESLLVQGADKNYAMYGGQDASALAWASKFGHLKCVEILLAAGADVAAIDDAYFTPLELAITRGHNAVIQALLQPSVDSINSTDGDSTILHFLATNGCLKGVKICLEAGARPNRVDDEGRAAWEWAHDEGHTEIVHLLKPNDQ